LRTRKSVLIQSGVQLGLDGYFRIGYGGETHGLRQALGRIDEWIDESSRAAAGSQGR
jgi:hypothetical protein